jgi:uncharacterized secreted protein with C-terminal beta-propeller domain
MEKLKISIFFVVVTTFGASAMIGCRQELAMQNPPVNANRGNAQPKKTLRAFGSDQEITAYFRQIAEEARRDLERRSPSKMAQEAAPASAASSAQGYSDTRAKGENEESVTNVQHAGVDEGGIVKLHGDHLVGVCSRSPWATAR